MCDQQTPSPSHGSSTGGSSSAQQTTEVVAIKWQGDALLLLDQRILPKGEVWLRCETCAEVAQAITDMVVRGAPAIGIAAAYATVLLAKEAASKDEFYDGLAYLSQARPTAVNLAWACEQARAQVAGNDWDKAYELLLSLAKGIFEQDIADNHLMGQLALAEFQLDAKLNQCESQPFSVLTHCNTGSLATGGYGTALGAIRSGYNAGLINFVHADETRPWMQGARLTAWELEKSGIPFALNADSASAWLMANKGIRWVIVGADRITANGDVANKVGTYMLAVLARYHGLKFMVVAPSSTVDMALPKGEQIEIEMRPAQELANISQLEDALSGFDAINPVFDVTPADLIDVIVTEKGAVKAPDSAKMAALFAGS